MNHLPIKTDNPFFGTLHRLHEMDLIVATKDGKIRRSEASRLEPAEDDLEWEIANSLLRHGNYHLVKLRSGEITHYWLIDNENPYDTLSDLGTFDQGYSLDDVLQRMQHH